jgi:hypothetical protein
LSDAFFVDDKSISFGWLSGSWVLPEYRRKGISTLIFNEVLKAWNFKLMYSNYAVASKLLYDKTTQFKQLQKLDGVKYYTRFSLAKILPNKGMVFSKTKLFWKIIDCFLNLFFDIRYFFITLKKETNYKITENENFNVSTASFIKENTQNFFQRNKKEFEWIQNYPWIFTNQITKNTYKSYYFSSYSLKFESNFYTIYDLNNILIGCLLITIRDGDMKIPYAYFTEENSKLISNFILNKSILKKVDTITIYNKSLETELTENLSYIYNKKFIQKFFLTKHLAELLTFKKDIQIQPGDGDSVFT